MSLIKKFTKKFHKSANSECVPIPTLHKVSFPNYSMPPNNISYNCNSDSFESSEESVIDFDQKEKQQKNLDKMLFLANKINFSFEKIPITTLQDNDVAISALTTIFIELENENFHFHKRKSKMEKIVTSGTNRLKFKKLFK